LKIPSNCTETGFIPISDDMKKILPFVLLLCASSLNIQESNAWGFFAHKKINELAVYTLPGELFSFYKHNINYLSQHATDPDMRRYAFPEEGPRHFLDADRYYPLDSLPKNWTKAVEKYGEDTLMAHGIGPWYLELMYRRLVNAFLDKDVVRVIKLSADIGHYTADMHVPLHTTRNYNGQLTQQQGIHALWESRLPELFAVSYDFLADKAQYISNVNSYIWGFFLDAHSLVDSVLLTEKKVSATFPEEQKYQIESRGNTNQKNYSRTFSDAYHKALGNMVETQMKKAIQAFGNLMYSAWVDAGKPNLNSNNNQLPIVAPDVKEQEKLKELYEKREIIGRPEPNH
jgi:hypothetical protein